ncbi:hypothetical protein ACFQ0B_51560 [Nonomuraea thailandensis]
MDALGQEAADPETAFQARAAASACLAALHTALVRWAEDDGRSDLPDLIGRALAAVFGQSPLSPGGAAGGEPSPKAPAKAARAAALAAWAGRSGSGAVRSSTRWW